MAPVCSAWGKEVNSALNPRMEHLFWLGWVCKHTRPQCDGSFEKMHLRLLSWHRWQLWRYGSVYLYKIEFNVQYTHLLIIHCHTWSCYLRGVINFPFNINPFICTLVYPIETVIWHLKMYYQCWHATYSDSSSHWSSSHLMGKARVLTCLSLPSAGMTGLSHPVWWNSNVSGCHRHFSS